MDLQKFITESLVEIMNGLKEAQDGLKDSNARICPKINRAFETGTKTHLLGWSNKGQGISMIEYDIAVEVTNEGSGGGKISVAMGVINGGGFFGSKKGDKVASRIKFTVPVAYPDAAD
jgi:hypothetical protein